MSAETTYVTGLGGLKPEVSLGHWDEMFQVVLADARSQAVPYRGDRTASDRAWAARVDAAVHGMAEADPRGLNMWMGIHRDSPRPHEYEAELVALWETYVRATYGQDGDDVEAELAAIAEPEAVDLDELGPPVGRAGESAEDDVCDSCGWYL